MTSPKQVNVLIIDDNVVIRYMLRHILTVEGYAVVGEAVNGEAGLEMACQLRPDLICLDVLMPGSSGLDVLKQLKEQVPQAAVLIVTGNNQSETMATALRNGADGFIQKPFKSDELLSSVAQVVAKVSAMSKQNLPPT